MNTLAEQYPEGLAIFHVEVDKLLGSEESVASDLDSGIATIARSLASLADSYAKRVETVRQSREAAMDAAEAMNQAARQLGLDPVCTVPSSRVTAPGDGRRVHRAAGKGAEAIARAMAEAALERLTEGV